MQTPTIIFDYINKAVTVSGTTPAADVRIAQFAAAAQQQASSGGPRPAH
jgi:hypothetical protein